MTSEYPHELLERYCADRMGRRADLFGHFADDLFIPLVRAVADQLSVYYDQRPFARLRCREVTLREGAERTYMLLRLTDWRGPVRLNEAFSTWRIHLDTNNPMELAGHVNGRRWRFIDRWMGRFFAPMLEKVADQMVEYYQRRPYAVPKAGIMRFFEGIDATWLCIEIDDRSTPTTRDEAARYRVQ